MVWPRDLKMRRSARSREAPSAVPSVPPLSQDAGTSSGPSQAKPKEPMDPKLTNGGSCSINDLPVELIEKVFSYMSYDQISKIRRVSTRFNDIGSSLLNLCFQKLQGTMLQRFQSVKSQMPRRESARRTHPLARECDIVETVHMRLTLLQMSFGKHIERRHCCFFAGEILDEVYRIFRYIRTTSNLARAYKVTDELFDLTTMAMEYFKEYIEPDLPEINYFASDFLDYSSFSSPSVKSCTWKSLSPASSSMSSMSTGPSDDSQDMPTTNVLLKRRLKRLRQGMKKNTSRVAFLKRKVKACSQQIADQQKQIIEYSSRMDEHDKKFEENSRKFSIILQELNKCKTELQYWRSKSPANQLCCSCSKALGISEEVKEEADSAPNASSSNMNDEDASSFKLEPCEFVPIQSLLATLPFDKPESSTPAAEDPSRQQLCSGCCSGADAKRKAPSSPDSTKVEEPTAKRVKKSVVKCLAYQ